MAVRLKWRVTEFLIRLQKQLCNVIAAFAGETSSQFEMEKLKNYFAEEVFAGEKASNSWSNIVK